MKDSESRGVSQPRRRRIRFATLEGYSLARVMLFGLIPPALVAVDLIVAYLVFLWLKLSWTSMALFLITSTLIVFTLGMLFLLAISNRIAKYAKVKEETPN